MELAFYESGLGIDAHPDVKKKKWQNGSDECVSI